MALMMMVMLMIIFGHDGRNLCAQHNSIWSSGWLVGIYRTRVRFGRTIQTYMGLRSCGQVTHIDDVSCITLGEGGGLEVVGSQQENNL